MLELTIKEDPTVFGGGPGRLAIEATALNAIIKTNTSLPSAVCPTGDCTWPVTPSLAVCSQCADAEVTVTTAIYEEPTIIRLEESSPAHLWPVLSPSSAHSTHALSQLNCNYTTYTLSWSDKYEYSLFDSQDNSSVTTKTCIDAKSEQTTSSTWILASVSRSEFDRHWGMPNMEIANIYSLGAPYSSFTDPVNESGIIVPAAAYNCSLYACIRGFSATMISGAMEQQPIETVMSEALYIPSTDVPQDAYGPWWQFSNFPAELNAESTTMINVSDSWRVWLRQPLLNMLQGNVSFNITSYPSASGSASVQGDLQEIFWNSSSSLTNFSSLVQDIADSLTTHIRQSSTTMKLDERYAPIVKVPVQIVRVRWGWLAYPLGLIAAALVFLVSTIVSTRRRQVRPWKGHRMPLLLAHLDDSVCELAQSELGHHNGLDRRVGAIAVRLEFDERNGIQFRRMEKVGSK